MKQRMREEIEKVCYESESRNQKKRKTQIQKGEISRELALANSKLAQMQQKLEQFANLTKEVSNVRTIFIVI